MIENIAKRTVEQLAGEHLIEKREKELYQYGLVMLVEKTITICSILVVAYLKNVVIPGCIFMIFFYTLRKRTGGFHANSFWACYILSVLSFYMLTMGDGNLVNYPQMIQIATMVSFILIILLGAVNHPNMHLTDEELAESKKVARYVAIVEMCVLLIFDAINISSICSLYMSFAIIMCAVSLGVANAYKQEV